MIPNPFKNMLIKGRNVSLGANSFKIAKSFFPNDLIAILWS